MVFTGSPGISRKRKKLVTRTASSDTAAPATLPARYRGYAERSRTRGPAAVCLSSTSAGVASAVMGVRSPLYSRSSAVARRRIAAKTPRPPRITTPATIPTTTPVEDALSDEPPASAGTADHQLQ